MKVGYPRQFRFQQGRSLVSESASNQAGDDSLSSASSLSEPKTDHQHMVKLGSYLPMKVGYLKTISLQQERSASNRAASDDSLLSASVPKTYDTHLIKLLSPDEVRISQANFTFNKEDHRCLTLRFLSQRPQATSRSR